MNNDLMFSSKSEMWETPQAFFDDLNNIFQLHRKLAEICRFVVTAQVHDYCYNDKYATINFVRGRLKFGGEKNSAPFPSMVVIFRRPAKALH